MKSLFPALLALCGLLAVTFAAALAVVILTSGSCGQSSRAVRVVLSYVVDLSGQDPDGSFDLNALATVVSRRINRGRSDIATVRTLDTGSLGTGSLGMEGIEIDVFDDDPEVLRRIERLLARRGTFELRILANQINHQGLIEKALAVDDDVLEDEDGTLLAWWVPVHNLEIFREDESMALVRGYGTAPEKPTVRARNQDGFQVTEVLVVKDHYDITTGYVESASVDRDGSREPPYVSFVLSPAGGSRLAALTGENLPSALQGSASQLGIIIDGRLTAALTIETTMTNRGRITGPYNEEELEELADVLDSGPLPVPIKLVEKRDVEE